MALVFLLGCSLYITPIFFILSKLRSGIRKIHTNFTHGSMVPGPGWWSDHYRSSGAPKPPKHQQPGGFCPWKEVFIALKKGQKNTDVSSSKHFLNIRWGMKLIQLQGGYFQRITRVLLKEAKCFKEWSFWMGDLDGGILPNSHIKVWIIQRLECGSSMAMTDGFEDP